MQNTHFTVVKLVKTCNQDSVCFNFPAFISVGYGTRCLRGAEPGMAGKVATSLRSPEQAYSRNYNFFDPDNFFTVLALVYSGDRCAAPNRTCARMR